MCVFRLTNVINKRCKKIVQCLNEVCDDKQKTLEEKRSTLEQITKLTDHCITAVSHQLDTGSDLALLFSKKYLTEVTVTQDINILFQDNCGSSKQNQKQESRYS